MIIEWVNKSKKFHKQQYCPLVIYTPRVIVKKLMNNKSFVIEQTFPFREMKIKSQYGNCCNKSCPRPNLQWNYIKKIVVAAISYT